jgi:hypothetical protein
MRGSQCHFGSMYGFDKLTVNKQGTGDGTETNRRNF